MGAGCAFLTQMLLARRLGPDAFGAFAAALAIVSLATPLACFGIGGFWLKVFGQEGWQATRWFRSSLKYSVVTTFLVFMALFVWAGFGPHDQMTRGLLMILSTFLLGQIAIELVGTKLQLEERYFALALWQFLPHFLRLLLVAILAYGLVDFMTLRGVAISYAYISVSVFSLGVLLMWRTYDGTFELKGHGTAPVNARENRVIGTVKQVAAQSWPFGIAGVFYLVYFQSDIIFLKYIWGNEVAGIYNVAFVIMAAVYMFPSVVYQKFLIPKIHRWANHEREMFRKVFRTGNIIMFVLGLVAMVLTWLLAPWAVGVLFGEQYLEAVFVLRILALAAPIRFLATSVGSTLVTQEHMRRKVRYMGTTAVLNILLNALLIPLYGLEGAAIATVSCELCLLIIYIWGVRVVFSMMENEE